VGLAVKRVAAAQVDGVIIVAALRGRGCVAGEPPTDGTDGGTGEPGQHGAAQHAPARHPAVVRGRLDVVGGFGQLVVCHGQPAETTFWATVDRLWWSGWIT